MNIVIVGAGAVGTYLAKMLSKEKHNIVVVDENQEVLSSLNNNYDLLTVQGRTSSFETLKEANIKDADLFIAVTPLESMNLTACVLAKKMGAKNTVARIDNMEYLEEKNIEFFQQLGIHSLIYPEFLASQEIVNSLKRPWTRQWYEFCEGELILLGVKVRMGSELVGKPLYEAFSDVTDYRIAAIKRKDTTFIPSGKDIISDSDVVFFISLKSGIEKIRIATNKKMKKVHNVLIIGGSKMALRTSLMLKDSYDVKIIEKDEARANSIMAQCNSNAMIIVGDGSNTDLLESEGISTVDAVVSLTGSAETNILAAMAAKKYNVPRTIAEVENMDYISLVESLDIGVIINKKEIAASNIYRMLLKADVSSVKSLTFADAEVAEFIVSDGAKVTKKKVKDLKLPKDISIGGVLRDGKGMMIYGETVIKKGDHIVVFCPNASISKVEKYFK